MMKRLTVFLLALVLCLTVAPFAGMAKEEPDKVSYYQYPVDKTMQPATIFNPVITEDREKNEVHKSFFQYPDSKTLPQGSIWNKLVTTKGKK